jgi:hopene-associated glycosyltransferase HpnB
MLGLLPLFLAIVAFSIWAVLALARGGFWRFTDRDDDDLHDPPVWPDVTAVIPARNEADVIARSLGSVLAQDYPGRLRVILVDDQSDDGTSAMAARVGDSRLQIISGGQRPPGWTGKLWALDQGIAAAGTPQYIWLTDADIGHAPDNLRRLVARAAHGRLAMVSLMARLHCSGRAERALIPAFVYFFAMLYPFRWVNNPRAKMAAAAGGCVLVRRDMLAKAGGVNAIRRQIIDDCALARAIKPNGPIWLGISSRAISLRPYGFAEIRNMVARSAYAQLQYSPLALLGTLAGMALIYLAPVLLAVFASGAAHVLGIVCWALMLLTMWPILRFYRVSPLRGAALPLIAAAYAGFTLDSAVQHWRGRGGMWKGRAQAARRA